MKLSEELSGPLKMMQVCIHKLSVIWVSALWRHCVSPLLQDSARRIARVSSECKLEIAEDSYVESFKPHLMDVVHAWSSVRGCLCLLPLNITLPLLLPSPLLPPFL